MKLGCSSSSYDAAFRAGSVDQAAWLRLCADGMELDGVEFADAHFPSRDRAYLRNLKRQCTDLQLTIGGLAVRTDFGSEQSRLFEGANVAEWCDVAAYLGAPVVRVFAGRAPSQGARERPGRILGAIRRILGHPEADQRRLWSDVTAALRRCADHAAERGVVLALQNSRDGIVGSTAQLAQCVHDVGSPWLRTCVAPDELTYGRPVVESAISGIVQVHACMREVRDDGSDARVHWPALLQGLKIDGYRGFVMLDYDGREDPRTAVPRAARYLRETLHLLQRQQLLAEATVATSQPTANGASRANLTTENERLPAVEATTAG